MRIFLKKYQLSAYFVLTYGISWMFWVPLALISTKIISVELPEPVTLGFLVAGVLGPLLAAILLTFALDGKNSLYSFFKRLIPGKGKIKWYLVALFFPPALGLASLAVFYLIGGRVQMTGLLDPVTILLYIGMFIFQLIIGGGMEEIGWRGYALPRLLSGYSALIATVVLGSLWCLWHLPLFFIAGTGQSTMPFLLFALGAVPFAFMFTWCYVGSRGELLIMPILHASINTAMSALPIMSPLAGGDWRPMLLFTGMFIVLMIIVLVSSPDSYLRKPGIEKKVITTI